MVFAPDLHTICIREFASMLPSMLAAEAPDVRSILVQIPMPLLWRAQSESARIPMRHGAFMRARRTPMLRLALLIGFAFVCLLIVHDRLTNRL